MPPKELTELSLSPLVCVHIYAYFFRNQAHHLLAITDMVSNSTSLLKAIEVMIIP